MPTAKVARLINRKDGSAYGDGRNVPIERAWTDIDSMAYPAASNGLLPGESLWLGTHDALWAAKSVDVQ